MKKILLVSISMFILIFFTACNNSYMSAGRKLKALTSGKNYKKDLFIIAFSDDLYLYKSIGDIYILNDSNLSVEEKKIILEKMINDFYLNRGFTGKGTTLKLTNGDRLAGKYIYTDDNIFDGTLVYLPIDIFEKLPFYTLPFVVASMSQAEDAVYFLDKKADFIKKLTPKNIDTLSPSTSTKNIYNQDLFTTNNKEIDLIKAKEESIVPLEDVINYLKKANKM